MLALQRVEKNFGANRVLDGIDFNASRSEVVAIMGENGAGKSTLMNIISGSISDYGGQIGLEGKLVRFASPAQAQQAGIVMVHQELSLIDELSVAENILLGKEPLTRLGTVDFSAMHRRAAAILGRLGFSISPEVAVKKLRIAEQQLVEIAKSLAGDARVLILDEPTSALNEPEVEKLFEMIGRLKGQGLCILYISHHLEEIFTIADRVAVLRNGALVLDVPVPETTAEEVTREMIGSELQAHFATPADPHSQILIEVEDLWRAKRRRYGEGKATLARGLTLDSASFSLRRGEIVGLAGLMGSGRSALLEVLSGACERPWGGCIKFAGQHIRPRSPAHALKLGIARLTQDRKTNGLFLQQGSAFNVSVASLDQQATAGWVNRKAERLLLEQAVDDMNIRLASGNQAVSDLSGGNQQKIMLSRWLAVRPGLLLLDEPTRGVDVGARAEIYTLLNQAAASGLGLMVSSSDLPELLSICHRILVFREGRIVAEVAHSEFDQQHIFNIASLGAEHRH